MGFEGYRLKVLDALEDRQAEVERMEKKRREEREKKRAKLIDEDKVRAARQALAKKQEGVEQEENDKKDDKKNDKKDDKKDGEKTTRGARKETCKAHRRR